MLELKLNHVSERDPLLPTATRYNCYHRAIIFLQFNNTSVITVPADGLALLDIRASAGTTMTKFGARVYAF